MNIEKLEGVLRQMLAEQGKKPDPDMVASEALRELAKDVGSGPRGKFYLKVHKPPCRTPKIWIYSNGRPVTSTGVTPNANEMRNPELSLIARVRLAMFVDERANGPDKRESLMKMEVMAALDEALDHVKRTLRIRPPQNATESQLQKLRANRVGVIKAHMKKLKTYFSPKDRKPHRMSSLNSETVGKYIAFRTEQRIETQDVEHAKPRYVTEPTVIVELQSLQQLVTGAYEKHGLAPLRLGVPQMPHTNKRYATWDQWARLILTAVKGCAFDEDGRFRRRTDVVGGVVVSVLDKEPKGSPLLEEFRPGAQVLFEGPYSGSRLNNSLDRRLGVGAEGGAYDLGSGVLFGDGQSAVRTRKRREARNILPPLERAVARWEADALAQGFTYLIHDADGDRISDQKMRGIITRIAERAGVPWFRPKHTKPTGATLLTYGGMPKSELAVRFCTRESTLDKHYIELTPIWQKQLVYDLKNMEFGKLKDSSPVSRERLLLVPKRWPRKDGRPVWPLPEKP